MAMANQPVQIDDERARTLDHVDMPSPNGIERPFVEGQAVIEVPGFQQFKDFCAELTPAQNVLLGGFVGAALAVAALTPMMLAERRRRPTPIEQLRKSLDRQMQQ